MAACGKLWMSDEARTCEAKRVPGLTACLAHVDPSSRRDFLAAVHDNPALMTGLLHDLEVFDEVWGRAYTISE